MIDGTYAYLVLCGMYLVFWLFFYFVRKDTRFELLAISLFTMPLGVTEWIFWHDYFRPDWFLPITAKIGVEDLLWAGVVSGIGAVSYEYFAGRRPYHVRGLRPGWMKDAGLSAIVVGGLLVLYFGSLYGGINTSFISIGGFIVATAIIIFWRHDLLRDALYSGLFLSGLTFLIYQMWLILFPTAFYDYWLVHNISGVFVIGVPIEELLFTFTWGSLIGPTYELIAWLKLRSTIEK